MRVATWRGGAEFTIDEVPDPVAGPGQVVVRVDTCGICGTDVHMTQGLFPGSPPTVPGHEYTGTVSAVGEGVNPGLAGQAVVCRQTWSCGECEACRVGNKCQNMQRAGGFAEYALLPATNVHPVPGGLSIEAAALTEPAACSLRGLEMFRMPPGARIVVIGAGVMGLFTLAFARMRGAGKAIVSDPKAERRELASVFGADIVLDPTVEDLHEAVMRETRGRGVDVAFEAVGAPALVDAAVGMTRDHGRVQLVGVNPRGSTMPSDLFDLHYREITVAGAFGGGEAFDRTLALLPKVPGIERVVTRRFPLEEIVTAFEHAAGAAGVKTAIGPNDRPG